MIRLKAYILVETKKILLLLAFSKSFSNGFSLPKTTFNLNVFSKKIDSTALGLHKLLVRDVRTYICYSFLSIKKVCKEKVSDGHVIFGVGRTSFLDKP